MGFCIAPGKFGKPQSLICKKEQDTSENNTQPNVIYFLEDITKMRSLDYILSFSCFKQQSSV